MSLYIWLGVWCDGLLYTSLKVPYIYGHYTLYWVRDDQMYIIWKNVCLVRLVMQQICCFNITYYKAFNQLTSAFYSKIYPRKYLYYDSPIYGWEYFYIGPTSPIINVRSTLSALGVILHPLLDTIHIYHHINEVWVFFYKFLIQITAVLNHIHYLCA